MEIRLHQKTAQIWSKSPKYSKKSSPLTEEWGSPRATEATAVEISTSRQSWRSDLHTSGEESMRYLRYGHQGARLPPLCVRVCYCWGCVPELSKYSSSTGTETHTANLIQPWPCVMSFPQDGSEPLFSSLFSFLSVLLLSLPHQPGNIARGNVWAKKRGRKRERERERWERGIWRRRGNEDRWNRGEEEEKVEKKKRHVLKWRGSDGNENVKCNSTLRTLERVLCPLLFLPLSLHFSRLSLPLKAIFRNCSAANNTWTLSHAHTSWYFYLCEDNIRQNELPIPLN